MKKNFDEVVILAATRINRSSGSLKDIKSDQLGSIVIEEVIQRSNIKKEQIDEVAMGQVLTAGTDKTLRDRQPHADYPSQYLQFSKPSLWLCFKTTIWI